jgi:hypothetical protein
LPNTASLNTPVPHSQGILKRPDLRGRVVAAGDDDYNEPIQTDQGISLPFRNQFDSAVLELVAE